MTMDVLTCAKSNGKISPLAAKSADALRYDDLSRVLFGLESRAPVASGSTQERPRRERKARADQAELVELRACVATLKAENERIIDRIAEDLDALADRVVALEAQVRQPLWRRLFGHPVAQPELAERTRRKLVGKLRSAFIERLEPDQRAA